MAKSRKKLSSLEAADMTYGVVELPVQPELAALVGTTGGHGFVKDIPVDSLVPRPYLS